MNAEPMLATVSLRERQRAAEQLLRYKPDDGDVLLSYIVWPEVAPTRDVIEFAVRRRKLRQARIDARRMARAA